MTAGRQLHLGLFAQVTGLHIGAWRMPESFGSTESYPHNKDLAIKAERAKFDMIFYADSALSKPDSRAGTIVRLEPLTLLGAIAAVTSRVGLAATATTTYSEPYNVARAFATLDQISGGRAAWNVVTNAIAGVAANFGRASHPEHDKRYEVASEFVEVVKGLWDSWEDGAVVMDKANGVFIDLGKRHPINHKGKHFSVAGPLNISRPPQGHPVIIQAGTSEAGRAFAARYADVIFTVQQDLEAAKKFSASLKQAVERNGRDPSHLKIMPGLCPIVGTSEKDARAKLAELGALIDPKVAMRALSDRLGQDLSSHSLDAAVPDMPRSDIMQGHSETLMRLAHSQDLTLRELRDITAASMGHRILLGTPEQIADGIEEWFAVGAADGYNVMPPYWPGSFDDFAAEVVPILQKRGIFRTDYSGATLRDHLGLPRPAHPLAGVG